MPPKELLCSEHEKFFFDPDNTLEVSFDPFLTFHTVQAKESSNFIMLFKLNQFLAAPIIFENRLNYTMEKVL